MMYSVWNPGAQGFDYYEGSQPQAQQNAEKPKHLQQRSLGSTVDQAAWPLPADARPVGSGDVAIGRIASRKSGAALGDISSELDLVKAGLLIGAAFLVWKYVVKAPKRRHA